MARVGCDPTAKHLVRRIYKMATGITITNIITIGVGVLEIRHKEVA